jgi:hypothetical protein
MNKFEIKRFNYEDGKNPVTVYVSCTTSKVNPLEIEKDVDAFIEYMVEKYKSEPTKISFTQWIKSKIL